ncbi:permease prefix domain 1-containing protein [uncultured Clostridium sp.]|uniref:permease prefix domain 1-containing protein n=1 Tax=uncultured Clostridium sp. TaxID=59620 RepID=UPI0032178CBF
METIRNYLDNIFSNLPKSAEIIKLKEELLSNMEEKYRELKESGKTENEAIGIVISEFGNIDELIMELGIENRKPIESIHTVTMEEAENYMRDKVKYGKLIAVGVILCILAPAMLMFTHNIIIGGVFGTEINVETLEGLSVIPLFIFIAIAVGLFIYAGTQLDKYKYLEEDFICPLYVQQRVKVKKEEFSSNFTKLNIIGVTLCVLSPVALIGISAIGGYNDDILSTYGAIVLLIMVAIAVFIFIRVGNINNSYNALLQIEEYSSKGKENNKVIGDVASVVWPIATAIFLIWGLGFNGWDICWIVFPITGILFGAFSGLYALIKRNNKR